MSAGIEWGSCVAVERHAERVNGAWVFAGTRVPLSALFENLRDGASVHEFVERFPDASIEQIQAVMTHALQSAAA